MLLFFFFLKSEYAAVCRASIVAVMPRNPAGERVPIGRAIDGVTAFVLDESMQPVDIGASGELYIGGAGVAFGYLVRSISFSVFVYFHLFALFVCFLFVSSHLLFICCALFVCFLFVSSRLLTLGAVVTTCAAATATNCRTIHRQSVW